MLFGRNFLTLFSPGSHSKQDYHQHLSGSAFVFVDQPKKRKARQPIPAPQHPSRYG